jgi:tetratricopeptide (TPR) repeat protein
MEREHTLQWLDRTSDDRTVQVLSQIEQEWDGHHYPEAIRLCEHLIKRAEELQQHVGQGLAYCYLGETYRLMGVQHHQDAIEAFGKARVHFSLEGTPASIRNKAIAYWSLAMVLEQLPARWNDALRYYQSAVDTIQRELDEVRSQSTPPRTDRARLTRELGEIRHLISEDQESLLRQQTMGDSKIVGLVRSTVLSSSSSVQKRPPSSPPRPPSKPITLPGLPRQSAPPATVPAARRSMPPATSTRPSS